MTAFLRALLLGAAAAGVAAAGDPLFEALSKVKFINSGTVKAADEFVWGTTWSGRDATDSAANMQAGYVLYLEKYNITKGAGWGAGGAGFPYLWKRKDSTSRLMLRSGAVGAGVPPPPPPPPPPPCASVDAVHHMDTTGAGVAGGGVADSWEACRAMCCANPKCGVYTYVNGSKAPNAKMCYLRDLSSKLTPSPSCVATNPTYDCYSGARPPVTCVANDPSHHMDTTGNTIGVQNNVSDWQACRALCCANPKCGVYTYVNGTKAENYRSCYLRDMAAQISPSPNCDASNPTYDCYSGERPGRPPPPPPAPPAPPPLTDIEDPPSGMRSAVPLGGISCGAVELRADGSFREWTIMNQSPGGSGKIQVVPDAYLAVKVGDAAPAALQTHPLTPGVKGVSQLTYSGSHPVSRLSVPASDVGGLGVDLFAYSVYKANDMEASARPMAAFTLAVSAPAAASSAAAARERVAHSGGADRTAAASGGAHDVTLMMNLPNAIEPDMARVGTPLSPPSPTTSAAACLHACNLDAACQSWNYDRVAATCTLQKDAPNVFDSPGTDCGLRGGWAYDEASQCLTLSRPGAGGSNGEMSLCASASGTDPSQPGPSVSFGTYDTGGGAFADLGKPAPQTSGGGATGRSSRVSGGGSSGGGAAALNRNASGAVGAVAVTAHVAAGTNATLTVTFGWHFPARDHFGKTLGNYYKNLFSGAADAAFGAVPPGQRGAALAGVVGDVLAVQMPFHSSSLDPWLQDHLVNSLSHIRTAMWFDTCPDCHSSNDTRVRGRGFWRQWEAFDCPDLDSIHNDGERHIPYIMLFPNTTRNKLAAWAGNQQPNGMLAEQIHNADPDTPEGRVMADSTSMFICYILELLRWTGDTQTLGLYYPTVKRAAEWQMNVSAELGVPLRLQTTYDILGFTQYEISSYSSVFHIMAMRAAAVLATAAGESADAAKFSAAADRARDSLDKLQWVNMTAYTANPDTYCPEDFTHAGDGMSVAQCVAACNGSCTSVFVDSAEGKGNCYLCASHATVANLTGYTLYNTSGAAPGSYAAASDECADGKGCAFQHGMFSDALYAQVLAFSAGLGTLTSSEDRIRSHLSAELAANCFHSTGGSPTDKTASGSLGPGCDKAGMVILTGRPLPGVTDWMIWEGAAPNHATLAIRTGEAPATALDNFRKSATSWSQRVNDQWNTAGIKDTDGYPTVTSHYGFHMVSWHVPLAISGQLADLSNPKNRSLTFAPALTAPFTLPLMLPGGLGTVSSPSAGKYAVALTVGEIELDMLAVGGSVAPGAPVRLAAGGPAVAWGN